MVEQAGMRASGTHLGQIELERLDRLVHFFFGVFLDLCDSHDVLQKQIGKKQNPLRKKQRGAGLKDCDGNQT
jgi:hypothetical protein